MKNKTEIQEHILIVAKEKFFRHGFRKVAVDDIASELQISKNTLYQIFPNKRELAKAALEEQIITILGQYKEIMNSANDHLKKLYRFWQLIGEGYMLVGKVYEGDLRSFHFELWKEIDDARKMVFQNFIVLFREGQFLRLIREDIRPEAIIEGYLTTLNYFSERVREQQAPYSMQEAFASVREVLFRGILSEKGSKQFTLTTGI